MTDDVFMITGASRGIGAATARLAAAAGYRLALVGRNADALAAVAKSLGDPARVTTATCDITDWAQTRDLVARITEAYGRLDVVLANAGMSVETSFLGTRGDDPDTWKDMVLTNVYGPALTARAVLPALAETRGHLMLTGSVAGRHTRSGNLYAATKWAVTGLAGAIRTEVVDTGVRTTVVQPGLVDTDMVDKRRTEPKLTADDVARAVMYAVAQPESVNVNEIVVRPTGQRR
ncbi:MAG TPA: SDR family oxidoreductase [Streptosporangiaceae bacterium]|jgi:NADP-dependent 3-hydroxy acid dehydrogenase YdfG